MCCTCNCNGDCFAPGDSLLDQSQDSGGADCEKQTAGSPNWNNIAECVLYQNLTEGVTEARWNVDYEWVQVENVATNQLVRGGCVEIKRGYYHTNVKKWIGMQWKCKSTPCIDTPQPQSVEAIMNAQFTMYSEACPSACSDESNRYESAGSGSCESKVAQAPQTDPCGANFKVANLRTILTASEVRPYFVTDGKSVGNSLKLTCPVGYKTESTYEVFCQDTQFWKRESVDMGKAIQMSLYTNVFPDKAPMKGAVQANYDPYQYFLVGRSECAGDKASSVLGYKAGSVDEATGNLTTLTIQDCQIGCEADPACTAFAYTQNGTLMSYICKYYGGGTSNYLASYHRDLYLAASIGGCSLAGACATGGD
jgi:hypothetical protein